MSKPTSQLPELINIVGNELIPLSSNVPVSGSYSVQINLNKLKEFTNQILFVEYLPVSGSDNTIYIPLDEKLYRWEVDQYKEVSVGVELGETDETAFRGDYGKTAYEHTFITGSNPHQTIASQIELTPSGSILSTNAEGAIYELATGKVDKIDNYSLVADSDILRFHDLQVADTVEVDTTSFSGNLSSVPISGSIQDVFNVIDELSLGHTIQDSSGSLPQRDNLKFSNHFEVTDNSGENSTDVKLANITTVGTSGDYTTIGAAVAAGKWNLKLISNTTETGDVAVTASKTLSVDIDTYTANFQTFKFVLSAVDSYIYINGKKSGKIQFAHNSAGGLFSPLDSEYGNNLFVENITIDNNSTIAGAMIADRGHFDNVRFELPNFGNTGISGTTCYATILNSEFVGGGTFCDDVIKSYLNDKIRAENLLFTGTFGARAIFCLSGIIDTLYYQSESTTLMTINSINKLVDLSSKVNLRMYGDTSWHIGKIENCNCKGVIESSMGVIIGNNFKSDIYLYNASNHISFLDNYVSGSVTIDNTIGLKLINNKISGGLIIVGDYNKITNNSITGASTIESGSEYNVITGNTLTGGLTDNSGSTTNQINNNI